MKLGLKEKIQKIIDAYKENVKTQQDAIVAVLEPFKVPSYVDRFTADGLKATIKEQMDEILSNWKKYDMTLNQQLKEVVASAKDDVSKELGLDNFSKPADYAVKIANARAFLQDELNEIEIEPLEHITNLDADAIKSLDETIHFLLKDFLNDYHTMTLFKKMIQKKVANFYHTDGSCAFSTFGYVAKCDAIFNAIEEIEKCAEYLFTTKRMTYKEVIRIKGASYGFPVDGYGEGIDEQSIIDAATILDDLCDHIDSEGQGFVNDGSGQRLDVGASTTIIH